MTAADIVESLQAGWLVDIAKAVTALGSAAVVLPLALVCAVLLGVANRWAEVGVLVAGLLLVDRRRATRSRTRSTGRGPRAGWSTPPAPRSRAPTPPTRPSTSGWR